MEVSISIDVPDLEAGVSFYTEALGFTLLPGKNPYISILQSGSTKIYLLKTAAGSQPVPADTDIPERHYARHWTPVHLDFSTTDLNGTVDKITSAGGKHEGGEAGGIAHCSDPFGHGFCVIAS